MNVYLFAYDQGVLFPKTTRSIQVFESSAVALFKKAAQGQAFVALGNKTDAGAEESVVPGMKIPFVAEIAGYGIPQIIEERVDGSLVVFLLGIGKCRLGPLVKSDESFFIVDAEPLSESLIVDLSLAPLIQSINKFLAKWITSHIRDLRAQEIFLKQLVGPEEIIHTFATYLVRDSDLQQILLETDSLNEKIQLCSRIIESNGILE